MFNKHRSTAKTAAAAADMATDYFQDGAQAIARSKDELMKEFENLLGAGEALLKSTSSLSAGALADARDAFSARLADAQSRYHDLTKTARVKSREAATAADDYVHANPWQVMAIGAIAGLMLGLLLTRSGESHP